MTDVAEESVEAPYESDEALGEDQDSDGEPLTQRFSEAQVQEIATYLRSGRRLPAHLFPHLFEAPKEYELAYAGKSRRVDVLAETMAVPLQPARTFGEPSGDWSDMLILGDNLQVLRRLVQMKEAGELRNGDGTDGARLIYIDPPFATRREFLGPKEQRAYMDKVAGAEFVEFLRRRLILLREVLADDGSIYVHLDQKKGHYIKVVLDEVFGEHNFRNEISRIKCNPKNFNQPAFGNVHDIIFFYSKNRRSPDTMVWNGAYERHADDRLPPNVKFTEDGRGYTTQPLHAKGKRQGATGQAWRGKLPPEGRHWAYVPEELDRLEEAGLIEWSSTGNPREIQWVEDAKGKKLQDIWEFKDPGDRLSSYPTEKNLDLLMTIVAASSNEDDIVLDAFVGSGTSLEAATRLNRRWIGIDSSKFSIYVAQARLLEHAGKQAPERPFTLYNAGLYDYSSLRSLPWDDYRRFVLQLFQCRDEPTTVGGLSFDGFIGDSPVLVFNFNDHADSKIGRDYVNDLASLVGGRIGSRCFIIAPALAVEPYEDYLDVSGTRFFFLRIPYSIIEELHKRAFSELRQPESAELTNATIESVGFDFIQPPLVECEWTDAGDTLDVRITQFVSEAFAAPPTEAEISSLAMVLLDYDYGDDVFAMDAVHFSEDIAKNDWKFSVPKDAAGDQMMIVYIDIYGNEHRETKSRDDFVAVTKATKKRTSPRQPAAPRTPKDGAGTAAGKRTAKAQSKSSSRIAKRS